MKTRFRVLAGLAVSGLLLAGVPSQAHAADRSATNACGVNYRCSISTSTSAAVDHSYNGVVHGYWPSGGPHSSSKSVNGTTTAAASTGGTFYQWGSNCACPSGSTCGV